MPPSSDKHNIVFVFTDQERYFDKWPKGCPCPGGTACKPTDHLPQALRPRRHVHEFALGHADRPQTPDARCSTTSTCPTIAPMSYDIPRSATCSARAATTPRTRAKWHLDSTFDVEGPERLFTRMDAYGFSDFVWRATWSGTRWAGTGMTTSSAVPPSPGCATGARPLADEKKPWALFVSLVNPRHHVLQHRRAGHRPRHGKTPY